MLTYMLKTIIRQICKISSTAMGSSVSVTIVSTGHTLVKIRNVKMMCVDFDIFHQMVTLQKLYSMTVTYFLNVKDSN